MRFVEWVTRENQAFSIITLLEQSCVVVFRAVDRDYNTEDKEEEEEEEEEEGCDN